MWPVFLHATETLILENSPWIVKPKEQGMTLRVGFTVFSYLLAAIGLACLYLGEIYSLPLAALILSGLAACLVLEIRKVLPLSPLSHVQVPKWTLLGLPLIFVFLNIPLLDFVAGFLTFILITRFIFKSELNDYLFGYLLSIACLLIGAIYVRDIIFGVMFLGFFLVLCWSLILYNMMVERAGSHSPPEVFLHVGERESSWTALIGLSSGLVLLSLLFTVAIFLSFPRIGLGLFKLDPRSAAMTGFSSTVRLGDVGKIKQNEAVVMRVEYYRGNRKIIPPMPVYWRGIALDHYNGRIWSSHAKVDWSTRNSPGDGTTVFPSRMQSDLVRQEVFMESFDTDIIFTHGQPYLVDGAFEQIQMDESYSLRTVGRRNPGPKKFTLISDIGHPEAGYPEPMPHFNPRVFPRRYVQVPPLSPEVRRLASQIAEGAGSPEEKARRVLKHLQTGFSYSLEMETSPNKSALDHFLFTRKAGHCEYFASAMVVLLRLAGVPSRMVNGFTSGEWNEMGEYFIIRQKHAHSWVEAFLPGSGWVIFDPTPPDPGLGPQSRPSRLARALDLMRLNWQRYVIKYSLNDQIEILNFFKRSGREMIGQARSLSDLDGTVQSFKEKPWRVWVSLLAGIGLLVSLRRLRLKRRPAVPAAATLYQDMLRRLRKKGLIKPPHQTHREFLDHLAPLPPEQRTDVKKVTEFYERTRFACQAAAPGEENEMRQTVRRL